MRIALLLAALLIAGCEPPKAKPKPKQKNQQTAPLPFEVLPNDGMKQVPNDGRSKWPRL